MDKKEVGKLIKQGRVTKGLLQKDVAKEMHVSPNTVSNWETGEREFTAAQLIKLARFLGIEKELFPVEEREKPSEDDKFALRDNRIHSLGKELEALRSEIREVKGANSAYRAQVLYLEKIKRSKSGLRILLVEDDEDCITLLQSIIPSVWSEDVKIESASGEDSIIKLVREGSKIDVVFLDMVLSSQISGVMILNMIREMSNLQHIFVICISSEPAMLEMTRALKAQPDLIMEKPISLSQLEKARSEYLKRLDAI